METIIEVIFTNEADAYAAQKALMQLDNNADISLSETYIARRDKTTDKAMILSSQGEPVGLGILAGTMLGGLVGLLAGPVGALVGSSMGMLVGATGEITEEDDIDRYLDGASKRLGAGKTMLIAHLMDDAPALVDKTVATFGGQLTRVDVWQAIDKANQQALDDINQQIDEAKAELAASTAATKAKAEAKVAELNSKWETTKADQKAKAEKRQQDRQHWLDKQKATFETWKGDVNGKIHAKKKEYLQKQVDKQAHKLAELRQKEAAL